jgi:hypothetical protein
LYKLILIIMIFSAAPSFALRGSAFPWRKIPACNFQFQTKEYIGAPIGHSTFVTMANTQDVFKTYFVPGPNMKSYREWIRSHTPWDAFEDLENLKKLLEDPHVKPTKETEATLLNLENMMKQTVGTIRPANCLESLLMNEMMWVVDLRKNAIENHAYIYRKGDELTVLADFYPDPAKSIKETTEKRRKLVNDGWEYAISFHTHPFNPDVKSPDVGGNLVPTSQDLETWIKEKPSVAVITNGFETFELPQEEFTWLKIAR